jgi:glycosyltransferase involved in cell wall biosynthesis
VKILMLITELGYGGAERAFLGLAGELAKRHRVEIALFKRHYASGSYARAEQEVGLPVHLLDPAEGDRTARWRHRVARLRALKDSFQPDATISFLTGTNQLNALTRRRDKVVVSVRGTRRYDRSQSARLRLLHAWALDPLNYLLADAVVSVSESLTREISGARGVDPSAKFRTISGYVDSARLIATASDPIEPEVAVLAGFPLLIGAGRMAPEKGFQHLVRRFAAIKPALPEAKLLLVGDGPAVGALKGQARGLGLTVGDAEAGDFTPFDVIFLGFRPDPHRYYRLGRAFVLSSMTDGFPNTLAEALATGVPILAVDAPWGAREVLGLPADPMNRPFATTQPIETKLGALMPRMDRPEFALMWDETLLDRLRHDRRSPELAKRQRDRLFELDVTNAAAKWDEMLEELVDG